MLLELRGAITSGPVLAALPCQQTGFAYGKQPVLVERYVHLFSLRAVVVCLHRIV